MQCYFPFFIYTNISHLSVKYATLFGSNIMNQHAIVLPVGLLTIPFRSTPDCLKSIVKRVRVPGQTE